MISEYIYMFPCDMNLRIGKVKNYNSKIMISLPSFKIGTNLKINLDGEKDKPDVKSKKNLTSSPIKNTNKILNLTSNSKKKTNRMLG